MKEKEISIYEDEPSFRYLVIASCCTIQGAKNLIEYLDHQMYWFLIDWKEKGVQVCLREPDRYEYPKELSLYHIHTRHKKETVAMWEMMMRGLFIIMESEDPFVKELKADYTKFWEDLK